MCDGASDRLGSDGVLTLICLFLCSPPPLFFSTFVLCYFEKCAHFPTPPRRKTNMTIETKSVKLENLHSLFRLFFLLEGEGGGADRKRHDVSTNLFCQTNKIGQEMPLPGLSFQSQYSPAPVFKNFPAVPW